MRPGIKGDDVTLLAEILAITEHTTDEVMGFRTPAGSADNRIWFQAFDQLARLRRLAVGASAHHLVVLVDTAVLHANARTPEARAAWLSAYRAIRDAIADEPEAA
ncbi:MAG: hypothetical protein H6R00_254 [Proteobacteria bacterium]|nr:hypothetical protein [Pseudomonadota bacterium]